VLDSSFSISRGRKVAPAPSISTRLPEGAKRVCARRGRRPAPVTDNHNRRSDPPSRGTPSGGFFFFRETGPEYGGPVSQGSQDPRGRPRRDPPDVQVDTGMNNTENTFASSRRRCGWRASEGYLPARLFSLASPGRGGRLVDRPEPSPFPAAAVPGGHGNALAPVRSRRRPLPARVAASEERAPFEPQARSRPFDLETPG